MLQIDLKELPTALIISGVNKKTETTNKYKYPKEEYGELSKDNIIRFIKKNFKNNALAKHLLSEPIPDHPINEFNVYKLVANNVDDFIFKISINFTVFTLFCHFTVPECHEIEDRFNRLALKLKNEKKNNFCNF